MSFPVHQLELKKDGEKNEKNVRKTNIIITKFLR
jgi:hypothetical protein